MQVAWLRFISGLFAVIACACWACFVDLYYYRPPQFLILCAFVFIFLTVALLFTITNLTVYISLWSLIFFYCGVALIILHCVDVKFWGLLFVQIISVPGKWQLFAFSAVVGQQEGHPACKTEWWSAGVVICLERGADLHMAQLMPLPLTVSCFSKIQIGFTFLVPAYPGSPGKRVVKRMCVCVCLCVCVCVCMCVCASGSYMNFAVVNVSLIASCRY